jgi:Na+-transporting methylmalonyl-CoA/oxaloacetate decarboxylase gamma subunit
MSIFLYNILYYIGYVAVPILLIIFFAKIKKSLWFTLPISFVVDIIIFWGILTYYEFRGLAIFMIIYQIIVLSILIAIITLISKFRREKLGKLSDEQKKSYFSKEKKTIIAVCIIAGLAVTGIIMHNVLLNTSDNYNQIFDKIVFSELIKIDVNDIAEVELIYPRMKYEYEIMDVNYYGDKSFINNLIFDGSRLNNPEPQYSYSGCHARVILKNTKSDNILFMTGGGDRFLVHYKGRQFYVKSPQLWEEIKK